MTVNEHDDRDGKRTSASGVRIVSGGMMRVSLQFIIYEHVRKGHVLASSRITKNLVSGSKA